jgi:hypothetical protein
MVPRSATIPTQIVLAGCLACSLLGCEEAISTGDVSDVYTLVSDAIPTVVTASWLAPEVDVTEAWFEFGKGDGRRRTVTSGPGEWGGQRALLMGLKADTEYFVQGVVRTGYGEVRSAETPFTTGPTPPWLPTVEAELFAEIDDDEEADWHYLLTSLVSVPSAAVILDAEGDYVWWYAGTEDDPPITRARLSHDRQSVLLLSSHPYAMEEELGTSRKLMRVALDGSSTDTFLMEEVHHDFVELLDGTLAVLRRNARVVGSVQIIGDELLEIRPDFSTAVAWSLWNEPELDTGAAVQDLEGRSSHANALDVDEERGVYLVGVRNLSTVFEVDRETGEVTRRIGGELSDYLLEDESTPLTTYQHQFQLLDDGIVVFDNGATDSEQSWVRQYVLDDEAGTAEQVWEYTTDPDTYCYAMGDVSRTDGGTSVVTWSTAGVIEEVSADGELMSRFSLELGAAFGYTTPLKTLTP